MKKGTKTNSNLDNTSDRRSSFRCLVGAQFFGAFNDNLYKQLILFLAASLLFPGEDKQGLAFAVFALPFVLFSGIAGDLSERFSKRSIIYLMKVAEIGIMILGIIALQNRIWPFLLIVLFVMGLQSAFFGPSKYGVIPELVPKKSLLNANGTIAMTTFLSVLLGQALAGPLMDYFGTRLWIPGAACVTFAIIGTVFARGMKPLKAQRPELAVKPNPFGSLFATIGQLRRQRGLMNIVVLHSLFWFNGGVIQQAIVGMGEPAYLDVGLGEKRLLSYVLVTLAIAIMIGSLIAPRAARRIGAGSCVLLGASILTAAQLALLSIGTIVEPGNGAFIVAHVLLAVVGFFGAFFVVPIQSYLQYAPPEGTRGQTFAVNNFMNFTFIFLAGLYYLAARSDFVDIGPVWAQAIAGVLMFIFMMWNRKFVKEIRFF
ncbi:MAG: MFS transporter [Proteobacteria bacterium]|nr:MFS transporter [Pseudomonadota bacterium]